MKNLALGRLRLPRAQEPDREWVVPHLAIAGLDATDDREDDAEDPEDDQHGNPDEDKDEQNEEKAEEVEEKSDEEVKFVLS